MSTHPSLPSLPQVSVSGPEYGWIDRKLGRVSWVTMLLSRWSIAGFAIGFQYYYFAPKFSLQHLLIGLAGVSIFFSLFLQQLPRFPKLYLGLLAWFFLAATFSTWLGYGRMPVLDGLVRPCLFMLAGGICGMVIATSEHSLMRLTNLLVLVMLLSAVLAIVQAVTGRFYFMAHDERMAEVAAEMGRAYGFFGNPNIFAAYLMLPTATSLSRIVFARHSARSAWIMFPIFVVAILATGSRSGIGGLVIILVCVLGRRIFRPQAIISLLAALLAVLVVVRFAAPDFFQETLNRLIGGISHGEVRFSLLPLAWESFTDRPIFGIGLRNFRAIPAAGALPLHNGVLEPFVEMGLFGGIPTMLLIGGAIYSLWWCNRACAATPKAWLWRAWFAGGTATIASEMLHGSGWSTSWIWSIIAIGFQGVLLVRLTSAWGPTSR